MTWHDMTWHYITLHYITYTHTHTDTYTHTQVHTYMYIHIHISTHIYRVSRAICTVFTCLDLLFALDPRKEAGLTAYCATSLANAWSLWKIHGTFISLPTWYLEESYIEIAKIVKIAKIAVYVNSIGHADWLFQSFQSFQLSNLCRMGKTCYCNVLSSSGQPDADSSDMFRWSHPGSFKGLRVLR